MDFIHIIPICTVEFVVIYSIFRLKKRNDFRTGDNLQKKHLFSKHGQYAKALLKTLRATNSNFRIRSYAISTKLCPQNVHILAMRSGVFPCFSGAFGVYCQGIKKKGRIHGRKPIDSSFFQKKKG